MQAAELGVLTDPGLGDAGSIAGELWNGIVFIGHVVVMHASGEHDVGPAQVVLGGGPDVLVDEPDSQRAWASAAMRRMPCGGMNALTDPVSGKARLNVTNDQAYSGKRHRIRRVCWGVN